MYHTTDIGIYFIANVLSLMQAQFHLLYDFTLMGSLLFTKQVSSVQYSLLVALKVGG